MSRILSLCNQMQITADFNKLKQHIDILNCELTAAESLFLQIERLYAISGGDVTLFKQQEFIRNEISKIKCRITLIESIATNIFKTSKSIADCLQQATKQINIARENTPQ